MLAGESGSYADEVEGCYGVRPTHTDEAVFAAAHERLEELLPGDGPLAERHERWQSRCLVPADQVERLLAAVIEEARAWTRRLVELPAGEGVVLEIVRDKPWWAFCDYLGDLRSRIAVNVDLPLSAIELLILAIHETYPGPPHGASCKEHLARARPRAARGDAGAGAHAAVARLRGDRRCSRRTCCSRATAGPALAAVVHDAGIELDLAHALAVERALEPCRWAEVNAALMLHEGARARPRRRRISSAGG